MRKLLIAVAAVAATAAVPTSAGAAGPDLPGTCDLINNTMCDVPDHVPTSCELQEMLGVQNVRACEDPDWM